MKEERVPIREFFETEEDACTSCSEKTVNCCGLFHIKRWCLLILLLSLLTLGFMIPFIIYAAFFGEATSCRLTYSTNNNVTEADMQGWMKKDNWPLSVPTYDSWRRTCVCKGYEDKDPMTLKPTDEVLVWIAPGDLVSLSDEGKIPALDSNFVTKHRLHYAKEEHVKVCLQQELVVDLWNIANDTADGGRHCHATTGDTSSNVERFFLGWDGALFCTPPFCQDLTSGDHGFLLSTPYSISDPSTTKTLPLDTYVRSTYGCSQTCSGEWKNRGLCIDGGKHRDYLFTCTGSVTRGPC